MKGGDKNPNKKVRFNNIKNEITINKINNQMKKKEENKFNPVSFFGSFFKTEKKNNKSRNAITGYNNMVQSNIQFARGSLKKNPNKSNANLNNKINETAKLSHGKTPQKERQQQIKRRYTPSLERRNNPLPILPATIPARVPNNKSRQNQLEAYKKANNMERNVQRNAKKGGKTRKNKRRTRRVTKKRGRKSKKN